MEQEKILKDFAKWSDDKLDFKNLVGGMLGGIIETIDGYLFSAALKVAFDKMPDEHKPKVLEALDAITTGRYNELIDFSVDEVVVLLKTPLGDAKEKIIIGGLIDIIFKLVDESRK